jgi:hypothetical protein
MTKDEAIGLVRERLERHQPDSYRVVVVPDASYQEGDWWYIGVKPTRDDIRRYDYYDVMAQVSREIEDETQANITLVPPPSGVSTQ